MGEYLINLDTEIFLTLNSWHALFWDIVMKMATGKLIWAGMYAALIYAMYKTFGWRTTVVMVLMVALTITAADQITASLLRPIFQRLRPANLDNPIAPLVHVVNGYRSSSYGFPSCHAANTFALTTILSLLFCRWRFTLFMLLWALVNCYSRIYLGVHYPGDLLVGSIIGCICGCVFFFVGRFLIYHWRGARMPGAHDRLRDATINGWRFHYRPIDVAILVELLTMAYILICGASIIM